MQSPLTLAIDIDQTLLAYPAFFTTLGAAFIQAGHRVYILTGNNHEQANKKLTLLAMKYPVKFYNLVIDTSQMNDEEWQMAKAGTEFALVAAKFKMRMAKQLKIDIIFDDQAMDLRMFGQTPVFEVR